MLKSLDLLKEEVENGVVGCRNLNNNRFIPKGRIHLILPYQVQIIYNKNETSKKMNYSTGEVPDALILGKKIYPEYNNYEAYICRIIKHPVREAITNFLNTKTFLNLNFFR